MNGGLDQRGISSDARQAWQSRAGHTAALEHWRSYALVELVGQSVNRRDWKRESVENESDGVRKLPLVVLDSELRCSANRRRRRMRRPSLYGDEAW